MVDVGDDGYVPQVRTNGHSARPSPGLGQPGESMAASPMDHTSA
jgi:hypothetical protein